ncbi:unnamed protein product [Caenorhabditis auriculariae]|uniref:Serine hydrolase domain-containing protein n=1 Tax=Caenorhabditis auriculariae TaxID=2777116 RepID=A0A8S1HTC1_9PELO|nr:unnamed protein product [Caenorhabditis auriculariae]
MTSICGVYTSTSWFSTTALMRKTSPFVYRKTGRICGNAVLTRQEWRYTKAVGRHFQRTMGLKYGFDMGLDDRILLTSIAQRQRRLDDKKMRQLGSIMEGRIIDVMSMDETLAELAIQLTNVAVDRNFSHVNVSWLRRGQGDEEVQKTLDEERHQMRRRVGEMLGITCPEIRFIGENTKLMEEEMDRLFREADYGMDYRSLSKTGRVLGALSKTADKEVSAPEKPPRPWLKAIQKRKEQRKSEMTAPRKLKVLCLHGYRQCGKSFREKTGSTRKLVKNLADFEFVDAPHTARADNDVPTSRAWWFSNSGEVSFSSREPTDVDVGFEESMEHLVAFIKEHGPFDGLFGFSQGASMVHLLLAKIQLGEIDLPGIRFAFLFSSFLSISTQHERFTQATIDDVETLHVFGDADEIVSRDKSERCAERFSKSPQRIVHEGGHLVPSMTKHREVLVDFLRRQTVQ